MAISNKGTDSSSVLGGVSRGESLVSHVEEGEVVVLEEELGQFGPLFGSGIDSSWVVGTCMKQDNALLWCILK